ncbi:MAG: energy-coupling factor transporter ATPase [Mycoplasma sp.]
MSEKNLNIIEVENLNFGYSPKKLVIKNLSVKIPRGKYTTILGHNGSGKSTLCKLLLGIIFSHDGTVKINDFDIYKDYEQARKFLGVVFQNPENQFIGTTVRDDIAFGLENNCIDPKLMDEIILKNAKIVKMEEYLDFEPQRLSGGQKQKVAIASVLALNTEILIFDESTSMLDPKSKRELRALMVDICRKNKKTVISVTHDMNEANSADNIIVLKDGELLIEGTPKYVFSHGSIIKKSKLDEPFPLLLSKEINKKDKNFPRTLSYEELVKNLCK